MWQVLADPDADLGLVITRAQRPNGPVAVLTWTSVAGARYKVQYQHHADPARAVAGLRGRHGQRAPSVPPEVPLALIGAGTPSAGFYRLVLPQPMIFEYWTPVLLGISPAARFSLQAGNASRRATSCGSMASIAD